MVDLTLIKLIKREVPLSKKKIIEVIDEVLKYEKIKRKVSLSIIIVSLTKIRNNNRLYRKKDKPTDILSFPFDKNNIGDLLICHDYIVKDYINYEHSLKAHYIRLVIHGVLHLLGYDHIKFKDFNIMSEKEKNIINIISKKQNIKINF